MLADFEWSERLGRWVRFGDRAAHGVPGSLLGAAVAFIVGHLIRLQVLTHREEIEVSQLVGATAADVRRPFLYHGGAPGAPGGGRGRRTAPGRQPLGWAMSCRRSPRTMPLNLK